MESQFIEPITLRTDRPTAQLQPSPHSPIRVATLWAMTDQPSATTGHLRRQLRSRPLRPSAAGRIVPRTVRVGPGLAAASRSAPHKLQRQPTSAQHRVEMLRLAVGGHSALHVSTLEIDRGGVSYTVETLEAIHQQFPETELFFLMGADSLEDLPNWRSRSESANWPSPSWCAGRIARTVLRVLCSTW